MLRAEKPYNSKRYLLNLNTGEIHDLLNETPMCRINEIKDFYTDDDLISIKFEAGMRGFIHADGCYHCLAHLHKH